MLWIFYFLITYGVCKKRKYCLGRLKLYKLHNKFQIEIPFYVYTYKKFETEISFCIEIQTLYDLVNEFH